MKYSTLAVLAGAVLAAVPAAQAADYPTKTVRMVIAFTPGGPSDILSRLVGGKLAERMGQPFVFDNRPGAGGNVAGEIVATSPADGYTLMIANNAVLAANASLYKKMNFNPAKDLVPVVWVASQPNILVVHPSVPAKSVKELIALAKSKPGVLNYSTSGAGTSVHLSAELFNSMAGVKTIHVAYKGAAEALTALISGQTDLQFASVSSAIPMIKSGRLRGLGVTSPTRVAAIPDVPTIAEAGLPGYAAVAWYGIVGPAGIPAPIINVLSKAALDTLAQPDVKNRLAASGVEVNTGGPEEFRKLIEAEIPKWAAVVKASGAKAD